MWTRTGWRTCLSIHLKTDTLSEAALSQYKTKHLFTILNTSYSQIVVLIINYKPLFVCEQNIFQVHLIEESLH